MLHQTFLKKKKAHSNTGLKRLMQKNSLLFLIAVLRRLTWKAIYISRLMTQVYAMFLKKKI